MIANSSAVREESREVSISVDTSSVFSQVSDAFNDFYVYRVQWHPDKYNTFSQKLGGEPLRVRMFGHTIGTSFDVGLGCCGDGCWHPTDYFCEWHWVVEGEDGGPTVDTHLAFNEDGKLRPATNMNAAVSSFCRDVLLLEPTPECVKMLIMLLEAYHKISIVSVVSVLRTEEKNAKSEKNAEVDAKTWRKMQRVVRLCANFIEED